MNSEKEKNTHDRGNSDYIRLKEREYYRNNRDKCLKRFAKYRNKNKEKINKKEQDYYNKHKKHVKYLVCFWRHEHPEKVHEYYLKRKKRKEEEAKKYLKEKKENDFIENPKNDEEKLKRFEYLVLGKEE